MKKGSAEVARVGLVSLRQVIVQAVGVSVSSTLLRALAEAGIPVHFLDWKGSPFGAFASMSRASPAALRAQASAASSAAGVQISVAMLVAKARNQFAVLRLYTRYRMRTDERLAHRIEAELAHTASDLSQLAAITSETLDAVRGRLLAIEGRLAAAYFRAVAVLLAPKAAFSKRERQTPGRDLVNVLLDYTYNLLYTRCHRAIVLAGLDPRLGLIHTDRAGGKLSLVYDLVEEFRGVGADRVVLALSTRGLTLHRTKDGRLSLPTRRKIVRAFERNLTLRCRYGSARVALGQIIDAQAKHLAEVLVADKPYRAFRYNH